MENQQKANLEYALKWGLIYGMVNILIYLLAYLINKPMMVEWWFGLLSLALNITILSFALIGRRKELGGLISFGDAFLVCFVVIIGGGLLQSVFNYVLYNIIDPSLAEYIKTKAIESATAMMEKFGTPQESIEKAIGDIDKKDFSQTPARIGEQYFFTIIFGGVIALIMAAIFKKNKKIIDIQ